MRDVDRIAFFTDDEFYISALQTQITTLIFHRCCSCRPKLCTECNLTETTLSLPHVYRRRTQRRFIYIVGKSRKSCLRNAQ